ncbi:salivary cystatin-L2-like [Dermacentor silvarum]|uniref:salivary cystatin-L2-like n=1 Tax=Dermacentor silvarum TaxID=543639 RepID=UPI00189C2FB2|nr:salivary cystatin-L2-like [Dermacentor silvarum]
MGSPSVAVVLAVVILLVAAVTCHGDGPPGAWQKREVGEDPAFEEMAHFAISQQVGGDRENFDTVLEILDVETQLVAGTNYRIKFKTAESTCKLTETYSKENCRPKTGDVKETCTAVVYDVPWESKRSVTSIACSAASSSK